MRSCEAERVDSALDGGGELDGVGGRLRSSDGVAVVEAVSEGNESNQKDESLYFLRGAC